jgi:hypothetical protein
MQKKRGKRQGGGATTPVAVCRCGVPLLCMLVLPLGPRPHKPPVHACVLLFFLLLQPSQALLYEDSALYVPAGPDWVQQHWLYIAAGCGGVGILLGVVAGVVACRLHARKYRRRAAKFYKRQASGRLEVCAQPLWPGVCMSLHSGVRSTYGVCAGGFEGEEWGGGLCGGCSTSLSHEREREGRLQPEAGMLRRERGWRGEVMVVGDKAGKAWEGEADVFETSATHKPLRSRCAYTIQATSLSATTRPLHPPCCMFA